MNKEKEQEQIEVFVKRDRRLKELTSQFLLGEIFLDEYAVLSEKEGPSIDLRAMGASIQRQEYKAEWNSCINKFRILVQPILNYFLKS